VQDVVDATGTAALAIGTYVFETTSATDVGTLVTRVANVEDDTACSGTTTEEALEVDEGDTGATSLTGSPSKISFWAPSVQPHFWL
jgi:hypothetical protein